MWLDTVSAALSLFGHRNWMVLADSAYPAQSSPGIETVLADVELLPLVEAVLEKVRASGHVCATVYTDVELPSVAEEDAAGISAYRDALRLLLQSHEHRTLPHEEIISRLDEAGQLFRVLIVKSTTRLPYTSVFLELGCGYWSEAAETRLRQSLAAPSNINQ